MSTLWLVEMHEDDWDYDIFEAAAVWAETAEEAERIVRLEPRPGYHGALWIASPSWRLNTRPAPTAGVVLVHWHAG